MSGMDTTYAIHAEGLVKRFGDTTALFASRQSVYRVKGVHQAVIGVRTAKELDACRAAGLAYVSGPAVSGLLDKPPAVGPADALPLQAA